jgi:hypothetical protein
VPPGGPEPPPAPPPVPVVQEDFWDPNRPPPEERWWEEAPAAGPPPAPARPPRTILFDEALFEPPSFVSAPDADTGDQSSVVRGSAWFVSTVAVGAALSFAFWLAAARLDDAGAFGPASSLWAQLQLVNYLTGMGLPLALARYGSGRPRTVHVLFVWALVYTAWWRPA